MVTEVEIRYEVWDIFETNSPYFTLNFKQYLNGYWSYNHTLPEIQDLKRLFPELLLDEIIIARDFVRWLLENQL